VHDDAPPLRLSRWDDAGIGICLETARLVRTVPGTVQICFTVWETTRLPLDLVKHLERADQVWVPTSWGREVLVGSGLDPLRIRVVPEGVDSTRFRPAPQPHLRPFFRFLCIGKWEERKGSADLVRTFCREFHPDEPVELVMHAHNPFVPSQDVTRLIDQEVRAQGRGRARIIVSDPTDLAGLVRLIQSSDAFVLPTRAEGWGLPILEAMACGLPCIVTDYGGHRTFANEDNSYLIKVHSMRTAYDGVHFRSEVETGQWAQPDLDHLAQVMRHVVRHPAEARAKGARARRDAVRKWSWDHAARIAIEHLRSLLSGGVQPAGIVP
jgi:glycosyltransferase involved in cell wall biosynthesis